MTKAIFFDCFGVLTTDYWKEFVATLPDDQVGPARALMYEHDAGRINKSELVKQVKNLTGQPLRRVEGLFEQVESKNTELLAYIEKLKHSYKIGLISNIGSNWVRESLLDDDEQYLFDEMIFSFETRLSKPDPEIFKLAADRIGEKLTDCVLIDDSESYCAAATGLGMQVVVYENFEQMKRVLSALLDNSKS